MATKIKGIYKGFKFFTKIFVVKEREMEIGYPTDVKHVSHIGWDGNCGNAPSWMNEFKTSSDFTTASIGNIQELREGGGGGGAGSTSIISSSTWSSQDFESMEKQSDIFKDTALMDNNPKKRQKRKKSKSSSSPVSTASARTLRSKTKLDIIEVVETR